MKISEITLPDGGINEAAVEALLKDVVRKEVDSPKAADMPGSGESSGINGKVLSFIHKISSELSEKGMSPLVPNFVKCVIRIISSLGIENVNIPVNMITDIMEFIESDPAKKEESKAG